MPPEQAMPLATALGRCQQGTFQTPGITPEHCVIVRSHLERFDKMTDLEKTQLVLLGTQRLIDGDPAANEEVQNKRFTHRIKMWLGAITLGFVCINITAVVTAVLVIGVRTGKMPAIEPITGLISVALDILKTIFDA
jgi:hypothetical protein